VQVPYRSRRAVAEVVYEVAGPVRFCCASMCRVWGELIGFGVKDHAATTRAVPFRMAHGTVGRVSNPSVFSGRVTNPSYPSAGHPTENRSSREVNVFTDRAQANGGTVCILTEIQHCPFCGEPIEAVRAK
jgi:hypothetical protein